MYTFWASENYLSRESFFSGKLSKGRVTVFEELCLFCTWAALLLFADDTRRPHTAESYVRVYSRRSFLALLPTHPCLGRRSGGWVHSWPLWGLVQLFLDIIQKLPVYMSRLIVMLLRLLGPNTLNAS